jgi:hypothetical protein
LNQWVLHKILKTKDWILVVEDKISLGRAFRINLF